MVSPSKKHRAKSRAKAGQNSKRVQAGGSERNRSTKPLLNKKFYLDLKSHVTSSKLESNLKLLGATIELFLIREVNVVVTDRPQWSGGASGSRSGSTPKCVIPSPSPSFLTPGSPATLDSPGDGLGRRRSKTRAEAMLERARLQPQQTTIDPLDNAARWGIPIWPLEKILRWLDKVNEKKQLKGSTSFSESNSKSPNSRKLKSPYIKIESVHGAYRPVYKELPVWPSLNLEFESGECPFTSPKEIKKEPQGKYAEQEGNCKKHGFKATDHHSIDIPRMTRKVRHRVHSEEPGSAPLSGYCEICQLNYTDRKKHLQAESHSKFVSNERNFFALDSLIKHGSNMEAFLKMNGDSEISQCTLFGNTRRSLRSVVRFHSLDTSPTPANPNTSPWKGLLSPTRKTPLSSFSNGHATRSTSNPKPPGDERAFPKVTGHRGILEVQCNGGGASPHGYGTRYGGKGVAERLSPSHRRSSHWDELPAVRARPQRTRTNSASFCNTLELSQLSPTGSDSGHHLRSRGQLWLPANLLGTTAEDELNPARSRPGHSSQGSTTPAKICKEFKDTTEDVEDRLHGSLSCKDEKQSVEEEKTYHGSSQIIKKKRLTAEEKLIEDNKAYYKLEVKNNKLRSSGHFPTQRELDISTLAVKQESIVGLEATVLKETPLSEKCDSGLVKGIKAEKTELHDGEEGIIKFRKIRLSELSLLSNEAENFMFGEPARKDSSGESSDDSEEEKPSKASKKEHSEGEPSTKSVSENKKSSTNSKLDERSCNKKDDSKSKDHPVNVSTVVHLKLEENNQDACNALQCDESSMGSIDTCSIASSCDTNTPSRRRKKRRTHAELFIHDNLDYYKFEIPGSRLRFQGTILPQTLPLCKTVTANENGSDSNKGKEDSNTNTTNGGEQNGSGTESTSKNENNKCTSSNATSHCKDNSNQETIEKPTGETACEETSKERKSDQGGGKEEEEEEEKEGRDENNKPVEIVDASCTGGAVEGLHFSFEAVPQSEPWYQTYQRQDEGEEFYLACLSDSGYYWKPFLLPYEMPHSELMSPLAGPSGMVGSGCSSSGSGKKRRNRFAHMLEKKPRKSPRCHASTLAILSSLMHHKKRKEPDKSKDEDDTPLKVVAEDDDSSRNESTDGSASKKELPTTVVEFTSESDLDMKEISQNIDKMFALCPDEDSIGSGLPPILDKNVQEDIGTGKISKSKSTKFKKPHKHQGNNSNSKKVELNILKQTEIIDIDPAVLKELANPVGSFSQPTVRCKGGPSMDVLTLLDGFSQCHCMEDVSITRKECTTCGNGTKSAGLKESSCNSSECGASSTCDTITYSDVPEKGVRVHGRKRKRKKNLTGWPVDKQRLKKRYIKKTVKGNENLHSNKGVEVKCNISEKVNSVLIEENVKDVNSKMQKSSNGNIENELGKCNKLSNKDSVLDRVESTEKHDNVGDGPISKGVGKVEFREEGNGVSVATDSGAVERRLSKEECVGKVNSSADVISVDRHASLSRTASLESSTHSSDFQPCVRVQKIDSITELHYFSSGVANNRRLRSASSSSFSSSSPFRKKQSLVEVCTKSNSSPIRRASARKKKAKFGAKWDSWSTRKRR